MLSIDTKKKELLGNFYRDGQLFTKEMLKTFDHDFPSFADGVVIPHIWPVRSETQPGLPPSPGNPATMYQQIRL